MDNTVTKAIESCKRYDQKTLLEFLVKSDPEKAYELAKSVIEIDLDKTARLHRDIGKKQKLNPKNKEMTPPKIYDACLAPSEELKNLSDIGLEAVKKGEVAVVTMAGGQGTRLGHDGPKGTFELDLTPKKSLFRIQSERLDRLRKKTKGKIPWLIMTGAQNHGETVKYFKEKNYFDYEPGLIDFFCQGTIPITDFQGNIFVKDNEPVTGPDGNGGVFESLEKSGNLERLKKEGIKYVFICGIDNALARPADPKFIGFCINEGADISTKSTLKRSWDEKAGIFCTVGEKTSYVEYTEISSSQAKAEDGEGNFLYGDIGIVMYVYTIEVMEKIAREKLPYHEARKKTPYTDISGKTVIPDKPNGIKFETFIFDSFEYAKKISVMRVRREEEFAPVKNRQGQDSPETALRLLQSCKENIIC